MHLSPHDCVDMHVDRNLFVVFLYVCTRNEKVDLRKSSSQLVLTCWKDNFYRDSDDIGGGSYTHDMYDFNLLKRTERF